jgi:hypothetical protein
MQNKGGRVSPYDASDLVLRTHPKSVLFWIARNPTNPKDFVPDTCNSVMKGGN